MELSLPFHSKKIFSFPFGFYFLHALSPIEKPHEFYQHDPHQNALRQSLITQDESRGQETRDVPLRSNDNDLYVPFQTSDS